MAKNDGDPSFTENTIREYVETVLHHQMAPLARWLVEKHPGLAVDKLWEVGATWLIPLVESAARSHFGRQIEQSKIRKMVFEIGTDLVRELVSEMRELGENPQPSNGKKDQSKTEVVVFPTIWTSIADPEIGFVDGCSVKHQNEMKDVIKRRRNAPDEHGQEQVLRDGFSQIEFPDFIDGGGRAPASQAEGLRPGCCCRKRIAEAKAALQAQRDVKVKADAPKPKAAPIVTRDDLRAAGRLVLDKAGAAATAVGNAGRATGREIEKAAKAGADAAQKLPGQIKTLGENMRTADQARAAQMRLAREQRQQARGR